MSNTLTNDIDLGVQVIHSYWLHYNILLIDAYSYHTVVRTSAFKTLSEIDLMAAILDFYAPRNVQKQLFFLDK